MARKYSNLAAEATLTSGITSGAATLQVSSVSGFPLQFPYTLSLDADTASKEIVTVTAASGTTLSVTRGEDGTSGIAHSAGARVRHDHSARDFREPQNHIDATASVHGIAGNVVGTTDSQTLTNKNLTTGNVFPPSLVTTSDAQTVTGKDLTVGNIFPPELATDAEIIAERNAAAALTNKDLSSATNLFPAWADFVPSWRNGTGVALAIGNGSLSGRRVQIGKTAHETGRLVRGSTSDAGSTYYGFTLGATPADFTKVLGTGWVTYQSGGTKTMPVAMRGVNDAAGLYQLVAYGPDGTVSNVYPGSVIEVRWQVTYEVA